MAYKIRKSEPADGDDLLRIWRSAVDATHSFVSPSDLDAISAEVRSFLPSTPVWIALGENTKPAGFMSLEDGSVEALFVAADQRGQGVGRSLLEFALVQSPGLTTVVNEQNEQALGFYEHFGFVVTGRSATDEQGRPYPILHMHLELES